ncbi:MAG TPA: DUF4430 domain-containing protein [Solirubrobacteraceae bacterium]|nr:DUF4430 domain-containing protein [Solirubrobacteraceae bacterium]
MKKVGIVIASTLVLAGGVVAPSALGSKGAASVGPKVSVQIKTLTKTLLKATTVQGQKGWITKGGTPSGKCSAASGAGALNAATHGKWAGGYDKGLGIFVTSILGVKPPSKNDFWEILINNKPSNFGICGIKLHAGEKLLFKIAKG